MKHKKHKKKVKRADASAPSRAPSPSQYRALLHEALVVPDSSKHKAVILAAGAVVELMDMRTMFRDRVSPVTRGANEILVRWGPRGKEHLGWLAKNVPLKNVNGPLFFVKTTDKQALGPWDRIRFFVSRADQKQLHHQRWWLMPWLMANAAEFDVEVKKAIRELGGRPDKKDDDAHAAHLYRLITGQEIDMKTNGKNTKTGKNSKSNKTSASKKSDKSSAKTKGSAGGGKHGFTARSTEHDHMIVKRLVKENPRKAGTSKAKIWDKLRKDMTVGEFVAKGGTRGAVATYIKKGWAKLRTPADA